ncbi:hypothetical protein Amet_3569 [Alkaliphilus metalliredigens QYMF]|uniref:Uncharacterized protein n=1 Tax=Alkaliphilus metalliredigens (strain QYMF) TaxID=293826 RepID=A6TU23_ALKMQ|nr:hypothetical protein [Alkaliphilus metalliredigens]ABR49691.1 hypothetical protein Amet_3569 [Alkaliphilus metalliredigens QYMF]
MLEVQFEKNEHAIKIEAVREQHITKEVIEEPKRQKEGEFLKIKYEPDITNA